MNTAGGEMNIFECPQFQKWIRDAQSRVNKGSASLLALTIAENRMVDLSSPVASLHNVALALDSERATTNLIARLKNHA